MSIYTKHGRIISGVVVGFILLGFGLLYRFKVVTKHTDPVVPSVAKVPPGVRSEASGAPRLAGANAVGGGPQAKRGPELSGVAKKSNLDTRENILGRSQYVLDRINIDETRKAKLRDLLVERSNAQNDADETARRLGLAPKDRVQAIKQAAARVSEEINVLLGAEAYSQFYDLCTENNSIDYIRTRVAVSMADLGVSLSDDQIMALGVAYADVVYKSEAGRTAEARRTDPATGLRQIDVSFFEKAAAVLTPDQLSALRRTTIEKNRLGLALSGSR